ncbi:RNA polymerase sigma factor [Sorangium sp. So ce260]|uniref:RNA polymerase sigma factor n=1 Tax=Sorangium sp. So ce260 TaxID=3133291 RepID=UPI003F647F80
MPTFPHASFVDRLLAELPCLLRAARRLTRSEQDAEDLAQATVVRAIERHADLRDGDRMRAWLLRIERSVLLNATRGARQRLEVIEGGRGAESVPEPQGDLEAELLERGFADEVERALARLPPEWREALLLREVEDLTYEEIADLQACPVGTVRSRLSRARLALVEGLSERHEETSWQDATASGSRAFRRGTTTR